MRFLLVFANALALALPGMCIGAEAIRATASWEANSEVVATWLRRGQPVCVVESEVPSYELPEVVLDQSDSWASRRQELRQLFAEHVYGHLPEAPERVTTRTISEERLQDGGVKKTIAVSAVVGESEFKFPFVLYAPQTGRAPVFVLINNRPAEAVNAVDGEYSEFCPVRRILERGYAVAAFQHTDLSPDDEKLFRDKLLKLTLPEGPRDPASCGAIGAWAWGASRVLDALEQEPRVDATRAAVIGHSRGGKTALWAGANDERFSLVVSNNSGCLGAALTRRGYGETVSAITQRFGYWFCPRLTDYTGNVGELPVDQHQLIALIAPRAVHVASADEDLWADPRGEWLGLINASSAYQILHTPALDDQRMPGLGQVVWRGPTSYHIRVGVHDLTEFDWDQYMDSADRLWHQQP